MAPHLSAEFLAALRGCTAVATQVAALAPYGRDYGHHAPAPPEALATPASEAEVVRIVQLCATHCVPLIPYGAGTSLEGHTAATQGGLCVSMEKMNKLLALHQDDLDVVVQPGISFAALNRQLRKQGLFFPLDAGPGATIGGMIGTGASGTRAFRYGTMKDNVLSVRAVLADGSVLVTGARARKSVAGYDMTRLLVGSEGTLAVVTEAVLRVHPLPAVRAAALCAFPDLIATARAVHGLYALFGGGGSVAGVQLGMLELLDAPMVAATNHGTGMHLPEQPTLLMEFTLSHTPAQLAALAGDGAAPPAQGGAGEEPHLAMARRVAACVCAQHGGGALQFVTTAAEQDRLFQARKGALLHAPRLRADASGTNPHTGARVDVRVWTTDVCVPVSALAACIGETQVDIAAARLVAPIVGHAGDGNFHLFLLVDANCADEVRRAQALNDRMVRRALAMGGTCTGEHGVGLGKVKFLEEELGPVAVAVMRRIKAALDPHGILNPGKKVCALHTACADESARL